MKLKLLIVFIFIFIHGKSYSQNIPFTVTQRIDGTVNVAIGYLSGGETWQFEYGLPGFAEGTGTLVNCGASSSNTIRMNPFQSWDFRVRKTFFSATPWSQVASLNNSCVNSPNYVGSSFNFDTNAVQDCWRGYEITTSSYTEVTISNENYNGGIGKSINMYSTSNFGSILVSPRFEDLSTDKKINFWLKAFQGNGAIKVGTITNPYDPATFHELQSFSSTLGEFQNKTVFLNNYNGIDKYIAFKVQIYPSSAGYLIDQFSYEQSINCFDATNFNVSDLTEHSAQINFGTFGQTNWELYLKNTITLQEQTIPISGPYLITGLTGNTTYQVKVRANCDTGLYSNWSNLTSFTTTCENIVPGYYTGFDESTYLNPCWSKIISNTFYNINLTSSSNAVSAASGDKYLTFEGSTNSTTYNTILVTPYISELNSSKRIRFKILDNKRSTFLTFPFTIGTLSNPADANTFTPLITLNPIDVNPIGVFDLGSFWQQYIIDFTSYTIPATNHYIAFRIDGFSNASSFSQDIFFDDFYFEEIPQCKEPTNIQVVNFDYDKATISWDSSTTAASWQVEYGPTGFTPGTGATVTANASPYTLNGLLSNMDYDFYIKSVCSAGNSLWSSKGYFKTRCSGVSVGYNTSFENETFDPNATCWRRTTPILRNYSYSPNYFINRYNNGQFAAQNSHTGTKLVAMRGGGDSPDTNEQNKTILVSPRLIDLDNTKQISFWVYCQNNAYSTLQQIVVGTLSNPEDYNTFTPYQVITSPFSLNQWRQYTIDLSSYYGTDKYIGIKQISSTGTYFLFVDDFEYTENPCRRPTGMMACQSGQNSATLTWDSNVPIDGSATWQIEFGELGFTPGTGTILTVSSNPFVLNNLLQFKKYQFRVRNMCSNNFVNWSNLYSFNITCTVTTPFYENFDQYQSVVGFPYLAPNLCWTSANAISAAVYVYSLNNINSAPNVGFVESNSGGEGVFVSPYLADFDNTKRLKFWTRLQVLSSSQNLSLIVGTVKNPLDLSTFVPFQVFPLSGSYQSGQEFTVDFSTYTGDSKHIAFKTAGYVSDGGYITNRIFFDDIYYTTIPTCTEPIDVNFSQTNHNSTLVQWSNAGVIQSTKIEYGLTGFAQGSGTLLYSNTEEISISNLLPSTEYDFYLSSICTNENSAVIGPNKIKTTCTPTSIPWSEGFNGLNQYGLNMMPDCYKLPTGYSVYTRNAPIDLQSSSYFVPDGYLTGFNDTTFLHCTQDTAFYTPMFHLEAGTSYKFSLQARKRYEYDFSNIKLSAYRGQEGYFHISDLETIGELSEYQYNEIHYFYTPVETADYSFLMYYNNSGSLEMISDNFLLDEGYDGLVNQDRLFNFNQGIDNDLIRESTQIAEITLESLQGNNVLKFSGATDSSDFTTEGDLWRNNQNSLSKVNFKIDSESFPTLFLSFRLKQTYNAANTDSAFRVVVNGNVIGNVIYPNTGNQDLFQNFVYDLTPYLGSDLRVSLQHLGKSTAGNGDHAYLDDIAINVTSTLGNTANEIANLEVYPNPTRNQIFISSDETIMSYKISNVSGQKLQEVKVGLNQTNVDLSNYASGIYFINIQAHQKNKTVKIVKE